MNKIPLENLFFSKTRDFLDLFLAGQCSRSPHTIKAYRDALTVFRRYVVDERNYSMKTFSFSDCSRDFTLDYLEYMQNQGLSLSGMWQMGIYQFNKQPLQYPMYPSLKFQTR
jgi:site-specific recombinase XerD